MIDLLASVNCAPGVLSPDTLSRHISYLKEALRERTRLLSNGGFGIIDGSDPRYNISATSIKPLWPAFVPGDYSQVSVYPGRAVTPNGDIVEVIDLQTITVPGTYRGAESLIIIEYSEVPSGNTALTLDGQVVDLGTVPNTFVSTMLRAEYESLSQDQSINIIVLGTVLWSDSTAPILYTDMSNGYNWNRPWFSAVDTIHRNMIGSGLVSVNNPHGLGLNDLAVGRLTIYDQLTSSGMVLSKDLSTPGIPGYFCLDQVTPDMIMTDTNGDVTAISWFSRPGRYYIQLSAMPNSIHGVVDANGIEYAVEWIKGTNVLLLVVDQKPTVELNAYYTRSNAGSISKSDNTSVTFTQCSDYELVIVGGQAKTALNRLTTPVRQYGDVPRELVFQVGASGQVYIDPTIVVPFTDLALSANQKIPSDIKLPSYGHVGIAMVDLQKLSTTVAYFLIEGTDVNGNDLSEIVYFTASNWDAPDPEPDFESPTQVHYTTNVFATFTGVTALDTVDRSMIDVGNNAKFAVFLKQDQARAKTARLATAFWDGKSIRHLLDARRLLPVIRDGWYGYTSLHQAAEAIPGIDEALGAGNRSLLVVSEDFAQTNFLAVQSVEWDGSGLLNVPVIDQNLSNSDKILRCYRSRTIPMKVGDADWTRLVVVLFGGDPNVNIYGSVRVIYRDRVGNRVEGILKAFAQDGSGTAFVGFVNAPWNSVSFVISGKCHGYAAYFVHPSTVYPQYVISPV